MNKKKGKKAGYSDGLFAFMILVGILAVGGVLGYLIGISQTQNIQERTIIINGAPVSTMEKPVWSMDYEKFERCTFQNASLVVSSNKDFSLLNCAFRNCNITFNAVYREGGTIMIGAYDVNMNGSYFGKSNIFMTIGEGDVLFNNSVIHDCLLYRDGLQICEVNTLD